MKRVRCVRPPGAIAQSIRHSARHSGLLASVSIRQHGELCQHLIAVMREGGEVMAVRRVAACQPVLDCTFVGAGPSRDCLDGNLAFGDRTGECNGDLSCECCYVGLACRFQMG